MFTIIRIMNIFWHNWQFLFSSTEYFDPVPTAKILKENGCISSDVILIFDEIYIQKSEEYFGGETFGTDEDGAMYNGLVCFMIIGLTKTIPYVLYSLPKKNLIGDWLHQNPARHWISRKRRCLWQPFEQCFCLPQAAHRICRKYFWSVNNDQ